MKGRSAKTKKCTERDSCSEGRGDREKKNKHWGVGKDGQRRGEKEDYGKVREEMQGRGVHPLTLHFFFLFCKNKQTNKRISSHNHKYSTVPSFFSFFLSFLLLFVPVTPTFLPLPLLSISYFITTMSLASVTYGLSITTIVLFGVIALFLARRRQRVKKDDTEFFLTARKSVPLRTIAWSFYAQGVGAWYVLGSSFERPSPVIFSCHSPRSICVTMKLER